MKQIPLQDKRLEDEKEGAFFHTPAFVLSS